MQHISAFKEMIDAWADKSYWGYHLAHTPFDSPKYQPLKDIVECCEQVYADKTKAYCESKRNTNYPV